MGELTPSNRRTMLAAGRKPAGSDTASAPSSVTEVRDPTKAPTLACTVAAVEAVRALA